MNRHKPNDQKDQVGRLLQRFTVVSEDLSRAFAAQHGMHHTAARAIVELMERARAGKPMTAGQLGDLLDLTPASVTALVDRMVAVGHVRRESDPTDRRRILLKVEPAAVQLGFQFFQPLADDFLAVMTNYSDGELELIGRFLQNATDAISTHLERLG